MRILAMVSILFSLALPALAHQATLDDRRRFAQEIANAIGNEPAVARAFHGLRAIQIGNGVIENRRPDPQFALADWRSRTTAHHGQVGFWYACDHWNVGPVSFDRPLRNSEIAAMRNYDRSRYAPAAKLVAELAALDSRQTAYVDLPKPNGGC